MSGSKECVIEIGKRVDEIEEELKVEIMVVDVESIEEVAVSNQREGVCVVFFFQADDGIRDSTVTGVQSVLFRS